MAFTKSGIIPNQGMIPILIRQRVFLLKLENDRLEQLHIHPAFFRELIVLSELPGYL